MHIHASQIIPNAEINAAYAAEKASAQREVENTRKKLLSFGYGAASETEGEGACVVDLITEDEPAPRNPQNRGRKPVQNKTPQGSPRSAVSDWA